MLDIVFSGKRQGSGYDSLSKIHGFGKGARKLRKTCQLQKFDFLYQFLCQGQQVYVTGKQFRTTSGGIAHGLNAVQEFFRQKSHTTCIGRIQIISEGTGQQYPLDVIDLHT